MRVVRIPKGFALRIKAISDDNVRVRYDLAHPQHGRDVLIKFDQEEAPEKMYDLRVKEPTELSREELRYLQYPLDIVKAETLEEACAEWARLKPLVAQGGWG